MGLDVYLYRGEHKDTDEGCDYKSARVEIASAHYPEHYFKIGYHRSSYNDGGTNAVLRQYGLPTLDDIYQADKSYAFKPDWPDVLARSVEAIREFDGASELMRFRVFRELSPPDQARDAREAMAAFLSEQGRWKNRAAPDDSNGYSNHAGSFYPDGLKVYGVLAGPGFIGSVVYLVTDNREGNAWCRQALEIVKETAEWVLAQPDPKDFHVHWSG